MSGGLLGINTRSIGVSRDMEMAALRLLQPAYGRIGAGV